MRNSRLLLLTLLPAYGALSLPLADAVPQASAVLAYSNVGVALIMFFMLYPHAAWWAASAISNPWLVSLVGELRFGGMYPALFATSYVAANLAFWLPVAHLVDVRLEKARRRRARRRRAGRGR